MSKVKEAEVVEPTADEKAKEAIKNLQLQLEEHRKQADYHSTMATKARCIRSFITIASTRRK